MDTSQCIKKCYIDGCSRVLRAKGLCNTHYMRLLRHGDPLVVTTTPAGHARHFKSGYVMVSQGREHVYIASLALGRKLPKKAEVHHVNGIRSDNRNCNLVICPDRAYHALLHVRTEALEACGNANYRRCHLCGKHDAHENLHCFNGRNGILHFRHKKCHAEKQRNRMALKRKTAIILMGGRRDSE